MRTAAGVNIQNVFQAIDDSNKITIIAEVPSPEIAQAFFTAPEIQEAMQKGGVLETVEVKSLSVAN